jgi:dTDP-4-dehydrorhamnose 3,5-epimerase
MVVRETALPGVRVIEPRRFGDARGFFSETWSRRALAEAGINLDFVQDNQSWSAQVGTVRGLHLQTPPFAQDKLVRVVRGRILDVAVDVRRGSPTYGGWVAEELSRDNGRQLLVPAGFLHGFATLEPDTDVVYKVSAYYAGANDVSVKWDDPDLAIAWGVDPSAAVVSDKDARGLAFAAFESPFVWGAAS